MSKLTINVDEAVELDIYCKQGRTFDLDIDLKKPLSGDYALTAVCDQARLSLTVGDGITIAGQTVKLLVSHQDMAEIPTGIYAYELVEVSVDRVDNLVFGKLYVQPSAFLLE